VNVNVELVFQLLGEAEVKVRLLEVEVRRLKDELEKKQEVK